MKKIVTALLLLAALAAAVLAFRHILIGQTTDLGIMEDPEAPDPDSFDPGEMEMLDGDYTYVANDALLREIAGDWADESGRWGLSIDGEGGFRLTLDGETLLEDRLDFVYLQPGPPRVTEFTADGWELALPEGTAAVEDFRFEPGENGGVIVLALETGSVEFYQTEED